MFTLTHSVLILCHFRDKRTKLCGSLRATCLPLMLYPAKLLADSLYCFLNILPLRHFVTVESILFELKYDRGLLPSFFRSSNLFPLKSIDHGHLTRNFNKLYQPKIINERSKFSLRNLVIRYWNIYTSKLDTSKSIKTAKRKLKFMLIYRKIFL